MREMIMRWLYTMLYSGCICGLILYVCPGGKIKELVETGAACVMLLAFLSPVSEWNSEDYVQLFEGFVLQQREQESQMLKSAEMLRETLIIEEFEAYICSEAETWGISLYEVKVLTEADDNGYPVPNEIRYIGVKEIPREFKEHIEGELGVAAERQMIYEDTMEAMADRRWEN